MADQTIKINEGTGKGLHTWERVIGGVTLQDEIILQGEHNLPTYVIPFGASVATGNDHLLQIMAGSSLNVRIREIYLSQDTLATTANRDSIQVIRLTTAGTGGSAITPQKHDPADAASGATAQTLPSTKGTEGTTLIQFLLPMAQTAPFPGLVYQWQHTAFQKPLMIAAGTANGLAIKSLAAIAAATVRGYVIFDESSF